MTAGTPRVSPGSQAATSARRVFGLNFCAHTREELLAEILAPPTAPGLKLVATVNVDHVVTLRTNPRFREAYRFAWRVTADGAPVYLYARSVGVTLPGRITGSDLFADLVTRWDPRKHRLFMLVSSEKVASKMTSIMAKRGFDETSLVIEVPPFGFELDAAFSDGLANRIRSASASHIVMAIGAPKSEIWAFDHRDALGDAIILCVGASVEFVTGMKTRSPLVMRTIGLEWFWRFATEPRRLFHRYFIRSFGFILAVLTDQKCSGELPQGRS